MRRKYGGLSTAKTGSGELNPLDGLANLADVMLVFACGLMLALVINWNVNLVPERNETRGEEVSEIELSGGAEGEALDSNARYEELGLVYRDPDTGKLYLVENTED